MGERSYYIGEVARNLGISQRTIRYYEELGFIRPGRTQGHFRVYAGSEVNRLKTVLYLKELGMSLLDINALLKLGGEGSVHDISPRLRDLLITTKKEFETRLTKYREGIKEMQHVLVLIEDCVKCKKHVDHEKCHKCIDERDRDRPPLAKFLF